jgi:hypothetical protein
MTKSHAKVTLMVLPLLLLLGLAGYVAWIAWGMAGEAVISGHAIAALALGVLFTLALTGGLVWLLIYSERHGFDR